MTITELGALGEFVGAIAVVVTLVYLAMQIKQNTAALKLSTARDTTADLADINLMPAEHAEFAELFLRGVQDYEALDGAEKLRLFGYFHKFCRTYENVHYQYMHNALEGDLYQGITNQFMALMSMPGARVYWQQRKSWYNPGFQAYVDGQLGRPDLGEFELAGSGPPVDSA